jgi:hypothetical protein
LPFEYLHIKVEDTLTANIASHFATIDAFLASAKAASGRAIVHCAFGQSRSVTAAVAHLLLSEKRSLGEALEAVRSRRPKACPNKSFLAALVRLELELFENTPSDLRHFPSLPKHWAFVEWPCPLRQNTRFVSCHGRVMRVRRVSQRPNVSVVSGFLKPDETDEIVRTAAPDLHPSLVVRHDVKDVLLSDAKDAEDEGHTTRDVHLDGVRRELRDEPKKTPPGEISAGRTSWNCRVSATHPAVRGAIQRAAYLSKVFPSHAEPAQVVRYLPGQKYNKHHDYFDRAAPSFYAKTKNGGQRLTTGLGVPPRTRSRRPHVVPAFEHRLRPEERRRVAVVEPHGGREGGCHDPARGRAGARGGEVGAEPVAPRAPEPRRDGGKPKNRKRRNVLTEHPLDGSDASVVDARSRVSTCFRFVTRYLCRE